MNKKVLSYLLFVLFCVVIVFPGYGNNNRLAVSKQLAGAITCKSDPQATDILLQCLSNGINMIEEERTNEEDDHQSATDYLSPEIIDFNSRCKKPDSKNDPQDLSGSAYFKGIFAPPECK